MLLIQDGVTGLEVCLHSADREGTKYRVKIKLILYADDTAIMAESGTGLQSAVNSL